MKRLLFASLKVRAFLSACIAVLVVAVVAVSVFINTKPEWRRAVTAYDNFYVGGGQARCEALLFNFMARKQVPSCEVRIPAREKFKTSEEFFLDYEKATKQRKDCIEQIEVDRERNVVALFGSGCPFYENPFGASYSKDRAPMLVPPSPPGTAMEFAWRNSPISPEHLSLWTPLIFAILLFSTIVARAMVTEPHVGWRRLIIVFSIVLAPLPLVMFAQSNHSNMGEMAALLVIGLLGFSSFLVIGRRIVVWIYSGFKSDVAIQPKAPFRSMQDTPPDGGDKLANFPSASWKGTSPVVLLREMQENVAELGSEDKLRDGLLTLPMAGPWRRFVARTIDIWILIFPVTIVFVMIFGIEIGQHEYIYGIALLPIVMILEAGVSTIFGNSPAKALLAIHLTTVGGRRLSFNQYFARGRDVYFYGMAMGIPFISLFPMIKQYQYLNSGRPASYDQGLYSVRGSELGPGRKFLAGIVLFALMSVPGYIAAID